MSVRVGVIGVGVMGAEHARLLTEEVAGSVVTAVFDVDGDRAASVARSCGAQVLDDPLALIHGELVDCVLVASADATHEQFVLAALSAGRRVLCEKPLAPDIAGCERILHAETALGRRLVDVGFMRRFDPGYVAMRASYTAGELGAALLVHCVHRNLAGGSPGVPALIAGSMVHELDVARWLLGAQIEEITVHRPRASARAGGAQDPLFAVLRMSDGALVDVEVFLNCGYGYEVRCELVGEEATVLLDAPVPTVRRAAGSIGRAVAADWRPRFADAYRLELQAWVHSVATGAPSPLASAWDGYLASLAAAAGVQAFESARPQRLPPCEMPALYR